MSSESIMASLPYEGYSAKVEAYLHVGDQELRINQVGRGSLMLRDRCDVPASTNATVVVTVDGLQQSMPVVLVRGISKDSEFVELL